jgi:hypothetical protein
MLTIKEEKNESVEVTDRVGNTTIFLPEVDLDLSKQLLTQFNKLYLRNGKSIFEHWEYKGYYFYPAIQEWLFWDFFVPIVKHRKLRNFVQNKELQFVSQPFYTVRGVYRIHHLLHHKHGFFNRVVFNGLANILRKFTKLNPTLVADDGEKGFRYKALKESLAKYKKFSRVEILRFGNLKKLFSKRQYFVGGYKAFRYPKFPGADYSKCQWLHEYVSRAEFEDLLDAIHRMCSDKLSEAYVLDEYLKKRLLERLITYDQIEDIAPLVVACHVNGVKTTSYQHGVLTKYHSGWLGFGIPQKYCNVIPDKIVVWGKYWKEKLLNYSNKYSAEKVIVGAHVNKKISYVEHECNAGTTPLTILLPYEFLADNVAVSEYLRKFLDYGWEVIVKLRPVGNGDISSDIFAYDEDIRGRISFKYDLTDEEFARVNVVACTQSTYAYEMMLHNKSIWYLQTPFTMLEDIVEDGIAYFINPETVRSFQDPVVLEQYLRARYNLEQYKNIFNDTCLDEFVKEICV